MASDEKPREYSKFLVIDVGPNCGTEKDMAKTFSYACNEFPGMEACPGQFTAQTEDELWQLIGLHASLAHGENPATWPAEDVARLKALIKTG